MKINKDNTAKIRIDTSDLVTNGDFATDTDWSEGTGWDIGVTHAGKANCDGSQTGSSNLRQTGVVISPVGKTYKIKYTISNYSAGTIRIGLGAYIWATIQSANKTYTEELTVVDADSTDNIYIQANVDFVGSIDNIEVVDITNAITPKLQKGLILDMPLAEPYTEANDTITKDRTPQGNDGTVSGATIKYDGLVDTVGGVAYINQDKAYGTWEFDVNKHDNANVYIHFISDDSSLSNGYRLGLRATENIQLDVITNGTFDKTLFAATSYISADTDYRIKITRNLANHFTTYIKGGVFGWDDWTEVVESTGANPTTTNDDDYTTSTNFIVQAVTNVGNKISNLKINGKRHSLNKATVSTGTFTTTAGAYDFDTATDERITLPYSSEIAMGSDTQDFTISMWIQRDDLAGAWRTLFDTRDDNNDGWEFLLQSAFNGGLSIRIGTSDIDASNLAIADNEWHHIVGVVDRSDTASLYVDGVEVSYTKQTSTSGITLSTSIDPVIGARAYATSEAFDGQISNLKVWNRVLSASDISYLYSKEVNKY